MKKVLLAMTLLAGSAFAGPRFSIGFGFGVPAPVPVVRPVCPGPGYVWFDGYYGQGGAWIPGYWRPPVSVYAPPPPPFGRPWAYDRFHGPRPDFGRDRFYHRDR